MKSYGISRISEKAYYDKLKNGLTVCIVPLTSKHSYYIILGVRYGSKDVEFIPKGEKDFVKMPYGIAHFLEHKAFEMASGEDPFAFFGKSGTSANASTSFETTKYYIWGTNNALENLDYLLTYVYSPYFTDDNIKKEQGIIGEEIKMYDDDPGWAIDDLSRKMAFNELPVNEKIAGTIDSISHIKAQDLYNCYNTFYTPNNMILVVAGDIKKDMVMDVINHNESLQKAQNNDNIVRKIYHENDIVKSEYKDMRMNVVIPKLKYLFKINTETFTLKDRLKLDMYLNMIGSIIFGSTSPFYEKIHNENIATGYYIDHNYYDNFYTYEFDAETDRADVFKDEVDKCLENIAIRSCDLSRMKRVWIASEIKMSDDTSLMAENIYDDILFYKRIYPNRIDVIESLNMRELKMVIKEISFDNKCFILINPSSE